MLAEWETRRPYLATVWSECQLWKSAPDAAFESSLHSARAVGQKKATLPARDAGKVTLRPKNRYILNASPAPSLEPSLSAAAFDVIHPRQRPLPKEELAFLQVIREAVEQSPLEPGCAAARAMMKIDDED